MEANAILNVTEKLKDSILSGEVTTWTSNADVPVGGYFQLDHGKNTYAQLKVLTKKEQKPNIWLYEFVLVRSVEEEALLIERLKRLGYVE